MKRILVTGGAGFIASHLTEHLADRYDDAEIVVVDKLGYASRREYLQPRIASGRVRFEHRSICDTAAMRNLLRDTDLVVHAAAESHVDNSYKDLSPFVENNILGTINLLQAAVDCGVGLFMHVSTDEVYGDSATRNFEVSDPLSPTNPYSASKAGAEMFVRCFQHSYDLPVRITRANNIYGIRQYPEKLIPKLITHALLGRPFPIHGDGSSIRSFLHVSDFCNALITILERGEDGAIYNVPSHHEYTVMDVIHMVCKEMQVDFGRFVEFGPDRPHNDCRYGMNGAELRALGWQATRRLEDDLPGMIEWYRDNLDLYYPKPELARIFVDAATGSGGRPILRVAGGTSAKASPEPQLAPRTANFN